MNVESTMDKAVSIGVIGGADGPTAIFVTSPLSDFGWAIFGGLLIVSGLVLFFAIKSKTKK